MRAQALCDFESFSYFELSRCDFHFEAKRKPMCSSERPATDTSTGTDRWWVAEASLVAPGRRSRVGSGGTAALQRQRGLTSSAGRTTDDGEKSEIGTQN